MVPITRTPLEHVLGTAVVSHESQPRITLSGKLGGSFKRDLNSWATSPSKSFGSLVFLFCGFTLIFTTAVIESLVRSVSRHAAVSGLFP